MERQIPKRLQGRAGFLMHKAGQRALVLCNQQLAERNFDIRQYSVLCVLAEGPCSQTELCEILHVDRSTMVQLIDGLGAAKLARRTASQHDRRVQIIVITEAGKKALERADQNVEQADGEFLMNLSQEEQTNLLALLSRLF